MRRIIIICFSLFILLLFLSFSFSLNIFSTSGLPEEVDVDNNSSGEFTSSLGAEPLPLSRVPGSRQNNSETITSHEMINDETRIIEKSITINSGGRLEIENSLVLINSNASEVIITVNAGGELYINNSNITKLNATTGKGFGFKVFGSLVVNNSEINHPGYETELCQVESCGGVRYESRYSPGLEIHSDSVEILNSKLRYAMNTSIYINTANPKIMGNTFTSNLNSISIKNSNMALIDNNFYSNFFGIDILNSELSILNARFIKNWGNNIIAQDSKILMDNVTINNSNEIIYTLNCTVMIENSNFSDDNLLWFYKSEVYWNNTTSTGIVEGIYFYFSSVKISNSTFENCNYCLWLNQMNQSTIENNSFYDCQYSAIEIRNTKDLQFKNNIIKRTVRGIVIIDSEVIVRNNTIQNSSIFAISESGSFANINHNLISNNSIGFYSHDSKSYVLNNTIVGNHIGIISYESIPQIIGNLIANNSEWGLNITNYDPVLIDNRYSDSQHPPNGFGRLIRNSVIDLNIKDLYGNPIMGVRIQVEDKDGRMVVDEYYYGKADTVMYIIPIYEVTNLGAKHEFNPFTVSASWGDEEYGITKESKEVNLSAGSAFNLTLTLPDFYLTSDDIKISDINPKHDDEVEFEITIHYIGSQVDAKDIDVSLTANGGIVKRFQVSFNATLIPQNKTFKIPWRVIAFETGKMNVRVIIDQVNKLENHDLDYEDNNIATTTIDVEGKELETPRNLSLVQICGVIVLIIVLLILLTVTFLYKRKRKLQKQLEKQSEELISGSGDDTDKDEDKPGTDTDLEKDSEPKKLGGQKGKSKELQDKKMKKKPGSGAQKTGGTGRKGKPKKSIKEKLTEDLNRDVPPRIKW